MPVYCCRPVDISTTEGRNLVHVMARLTLMDKGQRNERTKVSLAGTKIKGRTGGRPLSLSQETLDEAKKMFDGGMPVRAVEKNSGLQPGYAVECAGG